jgi:AbrB family looped-hinge helix DNA binding protein
MIKMIIIRKVGPKGQIVLPKDVRNMLGIKPGDQIVIEVINDEIKIKTKTDKDRFLSQFLSTPKKLDKKINIEAQLDEEHD